MNIKVFDSLPSTNDYIKTLKSLLKEDLAVQAKHQTKGKGRFGNHWNDHKDKDLLMSVYYKSLNDSNKALMMTTIALYNVLRNEGLNPSVKLPNDLYVDGKKISGILIEQVQPHALIIIGVGLNVNSEPSNDDYQATSLKQVTQSVYEITQLRDVFLNELQKSYALTIDALLTLYKTIVLSTNQTAYYHQKKVEIRDINATFQCKISNDEWIDCGALQFLKPHA